MTDTPSSLPPNMLSQEELDQLFLEAMGYVKKALGALHPGRPQFSDREDLKQAAWEELHKKLPLFDPKRGKLKSFALKVMHNALIKEVIATAAMARLPSSTLGRSILETIQDHGLHGGSLEVALGPDAEDHLDQFLADPNAEDPSYAPPEPLPSLLDYCKNRRERRILLLLSQGISYEGVGSILGLTKQTIGVSVLAIRARIPVSVARKLLYREAP